MYSPTLVEFKSIDMKIKIMKEKKMLFNHKLSEIIANNIFINENLTKTSRTLLTKLGNSERKTIGNIIGQKVAL